MYKEIQPERLYEQIVEQIEQRILSGDLRVGDQLPPERDLAEQFGVSRTAVREAVKTLRGKGLVEIQLGRGTFITSNTARAMRHSLGLMVRIGSEKGLDYLEEVREIFEPEIAVLAAAQAGEEQIAAMREAITVMDRTVDDIDAYIEADLDFHLALADAAQNVLISALIDSIIDLLREQRKRVALGDGTRHGQIHHKRIFEAVVRHDPDAARQAMREHLCQVREDSRAGVTAP